MTKIRFWKYKTYAVGDYNKQSLKYETTLYVNIYEFMSK